MSLKKASIIIILILLIDQISKIYIKTHFAINDGITVFSWFKIDFIENELLKFCKSNKYIDDSVGMGPSKIH